MNILRSTPPQEIAQLVSEQLAMPIGPVASFTPTSGESPSIYGFSPDEAVWISISRAASLPHKTMVGEFKSLTKDPYFDGVLIREQAYVNVALGQSETTGKQPTTELLRVSKLNTAETVNSTQVELGRKPGQDALKLVPFYPGEIALGPLIVGLCDLELRISNSRDPEIYGHDLYPDDHVINWICLSPQLCQKLQTRAQSLVIQYGEDIYLPGEARPNEVTKFINSIDTLGVVLQPVIKIVRDLASQPNTEAEASLIKLTSLIRYNSAPQSDDTDLSRDNRVAVIGRLRSLGFIARDLKPEAERQAIMDFYYDLSAHIANVYLKASEIKERQSKQTIIAETKFWHNLIDDLMP